MQHQRRQSTRAPPHHHRAACALCAERRQGPRQQCLEAGVVLRPAREQQTALVEQAVAGPQEVAGPVVRRHDPPAPVELDDAGPGGLEQFRERRAESTGAGQRLPDPHVLTDMGQETPDRVELHGRPAVPVDRVVDGPDDARAVGPVQANVDAVLGVSQRQPLVECYRGVQLRLGVEVGNVDQLAVGENTQTRDPFVQEVVELEVVALQFPVPLPAIVEARKIDLDVSSGASVAEHQGVAVRAEGVVDQPGGARPVGIVERRLVQQGQDAFERVPFAHERAFARGRPMGPIPIVSGGKRSPLSPMTPLRSCTLMQPGF